jgi:hypothetical protein
MPAACAHANGPADARTSNIAGPCVFAQMQGCLCTKEKGAHGLKDIMHMNVSHLPNAYMCTVTAHLTDLNLGYTSVLTVIARHDMIYLSQGEGIIRAGYQYVSCRSSSGSSKHFVDTYLMLLPPLLLICDCHLIRYQGAERQ